MPEIKKEQISNIHSFADSSSSSRIKKDLNRLRGGTMFMVVLVFSVLGVILGYYVFGGGLGGMFENVAYAYNSETSVNIELKTSEPARTYLEYGTSEDIVNTKRMSNTFEKEHSTELEGLLPGKSHVFRVVAEDQAGGIHKSDFFVVE